MRRIVMVFSDPNAELLHQLKFRYQDLGTSIVVYHGHKALEPARRMAGLLSTDAPVDLHGLVQCMQKFLVFLRDHSYVDTVFLFDGRNHELITQLQRVWYEYAPLFGNTSTSALEGGSALILERTPALELRPELAVAS